METSGEPATDGVDLDELRDYLSQTCAVYALLFGSRARGTADASSDVDIALRFPDEMDDRERFVHRNRIDAALQEYAASFVDVSDIEELPTGVAYTALRDGSVLVGESQVAASDYERVRTEYEATESERKREREAFIDRLARGDV